MLRYVLRAIRLAVWVLCWVYGAINYARSIHYLVCSIIGFTAQIISINFYWMGGNDKTTVSKRVNTKIREWDTIEARYFAAVRSIEEHALNNIFTIEPMTVTSKQGPYFPGNFAQPYIHHLQFAYIACRTWHTHCAPAYKLNIVRCGQSEKQSFNLWHFAKLKNNGAEGEDVKQRNNSNNKPTTGSLWWSMVYGGNVSNECHSFVSVCGCVALDGSSVNTNTNDV